MDDTDDGRRGRAPYQRLFQLTSRVTDWSPATGARALNAVVRWSVGNEHQLSRQLARAAQELRLAKAYRRFLVVVDLNIGDAVMLQGAVTALRDFFPTAVIDYLIVSSAAHLVVGNPEITTVFPELSGAPFPSRVDIDTVRRHVAEGAYDVVVNFCPFLRRRLFPREQAVVDSSALAAMLVHDVDRGENVGHVIHQAHRFMHTVFRPSFPVQRRLPFEGVSVYLSDVAVAMARAYLTSWKVTPDLPLVLFNPDTSSPYTRIPFSVQVEILRGLMGVPCQVVVGAGHELRGIETELLARLSEGERERVKILPATVPLDAYAALVDAATVFLTGDTGPLHVAASRKVARSGRHQFRNQTAILGIFGATPAKLYGYDSSRPGFLAAHQEAPSCTVQAPSRCRNITCINKRAKTCGTVRCFGDLDVAAIVAHVASCRPSIPARIA